MELQHSSLGIGSLIGLAIVLAVPSDHALAAPPTGLNAVGQLVPAGDLSRVGQGGFAFTRLANGVAQWLFHLNSD
jgi:hypothetical protein